MYFTMYFCVQLGRSDTCSIVKTFFFPVLFSFVHSEREACKTDPLGDLPGVYSGFL